MMSPASRISGSREKPSYSTDAFNRPKISLKPPRRDLGRRPILFQIAPFFLEGIHASI